MALEVWPTSLPLPLPDGYGFDPQDPMERTQMEQGHARVRIGQMSPEVSDLTQFFEMTGAQVRTMLQFIRDDIARGADWFSMPLYTNGAYFNHEVQLDSPPSRVYISDDKWRVGVPVITRDDLADDV